MLCLTLHDDCRTWEGIDWDVPDRLRKKGMIDNSVGKMKSVVFTDEGLTRAKTLRSMFAQES